MICDLSNWWALFAYDVFKSHVNVTEGLEIFAEERIRVGNEGLGQALSIKPMIDSRRSRTRLKQGSSWICHGGRFMDR